MFSYIYLKKKYYINYALLSFSFSILNIVKRPQLRGVVVSVRTMTPKKPNSAKRAVVKVNLTTTKAAISYIPGVGHNLKKHSVILVRGGGARDLPGVYLSCIRGVYDLIGVVSRTRKRSRYGVSLDSSLKKKVRRALRV